MSLVEGIRKTEGKQKEEELLRMQREIKTEVQIQQRVVDSISERGWDDLEHKYDMQHQLV